MKSVLSTGLLVIGVIIAASAGLQLGDTEFAATLADGRAALAAAPVAADAEPVPAQTRLSDWFDKAGLQFLFGLLLLAVGAFMSRLALQRDAAAQTAGDGRDFASLLGALDDAIAQMRGQQNEVTQEVTQRRIDDALETLVQPMIDTRATLQREFGLGGSALVLGPLAGAERQLNRAWSVLVDGHAAEAQRSLEAATVQVAQARDALQGLKDRHT